MKELNSPFRRLNAANFFKLVTITLASLGQWSCSSQIPGASDVTSANDLKRSEMSSLISISDSIKESWLELRAANKSNVPSPIRVSAKSCIDKKFIFGAPLLVLGQTFDVSFEEEGGLLAVALVDDSETKLNGLVIGNDLKDAICATSRDANANFVQIDPKQYDVLRGTISSALAKLTPDCRSIDFDGKVAQCQLEVLMPQAALVRTEEFQKAMIRKWSRQPYILARRTGVVSTLARTATNISDDESFAKFCRVLQFSLPEELPVVMTSRRWQNALCSGQSANRRQAAFYGLAKGAQELDMLRELYEGTSRVGLLSVKIPEKDIPGRVADISRQPLRVTIAPDAAVSKSLVDQAKKYLGRDGRENTVRRLVRNKRGSRNRKFFETVSVAKPSSQTESPGTEMCWHPIFSETLGLLRTADGMKLTGKGFNLECGFTDERSESEDQEVAALSRYLLQSLSSETEFVLDNGQSKLLRLPEGNYRYTVHVLPANPLDSEEAEDEGAPKSSGAINWNSTRRHAIRSW